MKNVCDVRRLDEEMVELPLLLADGEAAALAAEAHQRGLTPAQLVRRLIRDFIARQAVPERSDPSGRVVEAWWS
jgi:hypothetical protein